MRILAALPCRPDAAAGRDQDGERNRRIDPIEIHTGMAGVSSKPTLIVGFHNEKIANLRVA
jgi:hypothetical protein